MRKSMNATVTSMMVTAYQKFICSVFSELSWILDLNQINSEPKTN